MATNVRQPLLNRPQQRHLDLGSELSEITRGVHRDGDLALPGGPIGLAAHRLYQGRGAQLGGSERPDMALASARFSRAVSLASASNSPRRT